MLSARSVQNIDIFKKPKIKELILSSNSWDYFSNNINQFGNDPENKVRDFMIRQLNIQEVIDSILNLKIPEQIIEKGDKN